MKAANKVTKSGKGSAGDREAEQDATRRGDRGSDGGDLSALGCSANCGNGGGGGGRVVHDRALVRSGDGWKAVDSGSLRWL